jgi:hypothetical protein
MSDRLSAAVERISADDHESFIRAVRGLATSVRSAFRRFRCRAR